MVSEAAGTSVVTTVLPAAEGLPRVPTTLIGHLCLAQMLDNGLWPAPPALALVDDALGQVLGLSQPQFVVLVMDPIMTAEGCLRGCSGPVLGLRPTRGLGLR